MMITQLSQVLCCSAVAEKEAAASTLTLQQDDAYYASTRNATATSDRLLAVSQLLSGASLQQSNHTESTMHSLPQHTLMGLAPAISLAEGKLQQLAAAPRPLPQPVAARAPAQGGAGAGVMAAGAGAGTGVLPSQALQAYPGGLSKQAAQAVQATINRAAAAAFAAEGPGQAMGAAPGALPARQVAKPEALRVTQGAGVAAAGAALAPAQRRVEPLDLLEPAGGSTLSPVTGKGAGAGKPRPAPCKVFILVRLANAHR